jgi:hypothetical protein
LIAGCDSTQADAMIEFIDKATRIYSAKIARNGMSSDQPPGDLAGSGQGDATLLILRRDRLPRQTEPKSERPDLALQ